MGAHEGSSQRSARGPPQRRQAGILAWFHDEDAAAAAERELRQAGNRITQACRHPWLRARRDRISAEGSAEMNLDLATGLGSRLDAPGPVLLAVAVEGDRHDAALAIVRRHGGGMAR